MCKFCFFDLYPYIIIALFFMLCYYYEIKNSSWGIFAVLLAFCAFRYDVGWDYTVYVENINKGVEAVLNNRTEPFSKLFLLAAAALDFYPLAFFLFAFFTLFFVQKAIERYSDSPVLSWLVYFSLPLMFFASLSTIRQGLAMAIVFYAFRFILEKKNLSFFLWIFIATMFHYSAVIGVLIFVAGKVKIDRKTALILLAVSFVIQITVSALLAKYLKGIDLSQILILSKFKWYVVYADAESTSILQYLYYLFALFCLIFYNKLIAVNQRNRLWITMVVVGTAVFNILSFEPITAGRASGFFYMALLFVLPDFPKVFPEKFHKMAEQILLFMLISLAFFYLWMYIDNYEKGIIYKISFLPFKFWFNHL